MSWSGFLSIFILLKKEIRRFGCSFEWLAISSIYITAKFFRSVLIKYARQVYTRIMFYMYHKLYTCSLYKQLHHHYITLIVSTLFAYVNLTL